VHGRRFRLAMAVAAVCLVTAAAAVAATGALTPKGCIGDSASNPDSCAKTTKGLRQPEAVTVSPDGRSVYVAGSNSNDVVTFKRSNKGGALKPMGCVAEKGSNPDSCSKATAGLRYADGVTVSPDGRSVYVASYSSNAVVSFARNTKTGALSPKGCIGDSGNNPSHCSKTTKGLSNAESVVVSPNGKSVYVGGGGGVVVFKRSSSGALKPLGCVGARGGNFEHCSQTARGLEGDVTVALTHDGKSLYATSSFDMGVVTFSRNTKTGAIKSKGCIAWSGSNPAHCPKTANGLWYPYGVAVTADGKSLYVTALNAGALVIFKRDTKTGALTFKGCISAGGCNQTAGGLAHAVGVAVSPDGKSVYTAAINDSAVARFNRKRSGALVPAGCVAEPPTIQCSSVANGLQGADAVAVSPDGKSVYAVGGGSNAVVTFKRG
jgi:6-phosphogluconolactonase (cycloisomerase 2 family)